MKIVKTLFANFETSVLTLFLIVFSFGQLERIQLSNSIALYWHDFIVAGYVLWELLVTEKIRSPFKKIPAILKKIKKQWPLELAWVMWLTGGMVAGSVAGIVGLRAWLYLARLIAYVVFIVLIKKSVRFSTHSQLV